MNQVSPARTECPRCGYDLRGVVDAWRDECPLDGVCAECGLAFAWRDLLHPDYGMPRWCVEARPPWYAWPRQIVGTLVHAMRPSRYWSSVAMNQPIQWRRLTALAVTLLVIGVLAAHLASGIIGVADHRGTKQLGFVSESSDVQVLARVLGKPFSQQPATNYTQPPSTSRAMRFAGLAPANLTHGLWLKWWMLIVAVLVTPFTIGLAFAALPQARSRAKVRWRHIARVAMHGVTIPFLALLLATLGSLWSALLDPPIVRVHVLHMLALGGFIAASIVWWMAAVRLYLRMDRPAAVASSAVAIGLLVPLAALAAWYYLGG